MNNDLERSIRILEDAVSSTGRGVFKTIASQRKREFNLSITMNPQEIEMLESTAISNYEDTMNIFLKSNQTLSGSLIQSVKPWKSVLDNLHTEFFEILQNGAGQQSILEIVADLGRCCSDALNVIQGMKSKVAISNLDEEKQLEDEQNTWRLLFILYQDRLGLKQFSSDYAAEIYTGLSEKLCIEKLFKRDNLIREVQLVIDWLENCSAQMDDSVPDYPDYTSGWENTLHQIKSAETIAFSSSRKVVDKLDPDAPHYQYLPLHDLDIEDDKRLCKIVFSKIRCGKMDQAQEICSSCGHAWRAALLEGWKLYHNPNIQTDEHIDMDVDVDGDEIKNRCTNDAEPLETEGNPSRDIWKLMAFQYCKKEYLRLEEKASVAAYSGNLSSLLPVCKSWEDFLWAYLRTMVDIRVESEIRENVNREYLALPDWYWDQRMSLNEIFEKLESTNEITDSNLPEHIIQKLVILDDINTLMTLLKEWVESPNVSIHFLRFATHFVLFLDQIGRINNQDIIESTIEEYVKKLWTLGETRLVAFYLSKVSENHQISLYASYLENIVENEERREALQFAENYELNVVEITKKIVENVRNKPHEMEPQALMSKLTEPDLFKISSLDWVIFYETQRAEALTQSNALIFSFLTLNKLDAAQLAFNKIPSDTVDKLLVENGNKNLENILKEHLSYKVYLEAQEGFNQWYQKHKSKPQIPEDVSESATFTEKVAHQHKISQYEADLERWKITISHLVKTVKNLLYNVLLFPDGWLITAKDGDYLRASCIPEIVLLLYTILSNSDLHAECIQLADIIASEKYKLYCVYGKEKLNELLVKLSESALSLLKIKQNPWEVDL